MKNILKFIDTLLGIDQEIQLGSTFLFYEKIDLIKTSASKNYSMTLKGKLLGYRERMIPYRFLNEF